MRKRIKNTVLPLTPQVELFYQWFSVDSRGQVTQMGPRESSVLTAPVPILAGRHEVMIDSIDGGKKVEKPVSHRRYLSIPFEMEGGVYQRVNDLGQDNANSWGKCRFGARVISGGLFLDNSLFNVTDVDDPMDHEHLAQECYNRHWIRVMNPFYEEVALPNFLLELTDVYRLLDSVKKLVALFGRGAKIPWYDPLFAVKFGAQPLLSDILNSFHAFERVENRIRELRRAYGENRRITTVTNARYVVSPAIDQPVPTDYNYVLRRGLHFRLNQGRVLLDVKCSTQVNYDLTDISNARLRTLGYLRAFGFTNPLKVAWNAIPFSFVVDWIFDITGHLELLDLGARYIPPRIHRSTVGLKLHRTNTGYVDIYGPPGANLGGVWSPSGMDYNPRYSIIARNLLIGTTESKKYVRWVGLPLPDEVYGLGSLSGMQALLAAGLLHQIGRRAALLSPPKFRKLFKGPEISRRRYDHFSREDIIKWKRRRRKRRY